MQPPWAIVNKQFNEDVTVVRFQLMEAVHSDDDGLLSGPDRK